MAPAAAPRAISGSAGSRVRVILGATGSEWILLLNEDDGNRKFQTHLWKSIPSNLARQLNNCSAKSRCAQVVDYGPSQSWYVYGVRMDGTGGHNWWGGTERSFEVKLKGFVASETLKPTFGSDDMGCETFAIIDGRNVYSLSANAPEGLGKRVKKMNSQNKTITSVRLFANGGYFIADDDGSEWCSVGTDCGKELKRSNGIVHDVAVADDGSWLIIYAEHFVASAGVSKELQTKLKSFYARQHLHIQLRKGEIAQHEQRVERERLEAEARRLEREREALERKEAERQAREREERETREREEAERQARELEEREIREREEEESRERERQAREREEQARVGRVVALESGIEQFVLEEQNSIRDLESSLLHRKRALEDLVGLLPEARRRCLGDSGLFEEHAPRPHGSTCVVCHDALSTQVIVPCGHFCVCGDCTTRLLQTDEEMCPLCRGPIERMVKVFHGQSY